MKIKLYQRVVFTKDLPEHNIRKGDEGLVVEHLPATPTSGGEEGYALEIFNTEGKTIDVIMVPTSAVKPLTEFQRRQKHARYLEGAEYP